jgi:CMP-N-acetylneuraminic acid synthetase
VNRRKTIVAIIPARGGSKGIRLKNLALLHGKPLIEYTINEATETRRFREIVVTTDHAMIAQFVKTQGCTVIQRPTSLATDAALMVDVITHVLRELQKVKGVPTYFMLLQPTSPLRKAAHISDAICHFEKSKARSLISVIRSEHHPMKMFLKENDLLEPFSGLKSLHENRQTLPVVFRPNGAIYLTSVKDFLEEKTFFLPPVFGYEMPPESSLDIDSPFDLKIANLFLNENKNYFT